MFVRELKLQRVEEWSHEALPEASRPITEYSSEWPGFPSVFVPLLWSGPQSPQSSESLRGIYKNLAGDLVHSSLRE